MIPKKTIDRFKIEYEQDNFHIKSWVKMEDSVSGTSNSNEGSDD